MLLFCTLFSVSPYEMAPTKKAAEKSNNLMKMSKIWAFVHNEQLIEIRMLSNKKTPKKIDP